MKKRSESQQSVVSKELKHLEKENQLRIQHNQQHSKQTKSEMLQT